MKTATVVDAILEAAAALGQDGETFSAEDLVVCAWQMYPDRFGLQGYSDKYPDSNRVLTKIMGAGGRLRREGLLERVGQKRYRLTVAGRSAAAELLGRERRGVPSAERLALLSRSLILVLRRLLTSRALQQYRFGKEITFSEVAGLLNISARSTANQLGVRLGEATAALAAARGALRTGEVTLPGTSDVIAATDIGDLESLLRHVETVFAKELAVIRGRVDERYV